MIEEKKSPYESHVFVCTNDRGVGMLGGLFGIDRISPTVAKREYYAKEAGQKPPRLKANMFFQ